MSDTTHFPFVQLVHNYVFPIWAQFRLILYHWGSLPYFFVFTIINYTLLAFQKFFWWRLSGVKSHLDKAYRGECYETSAQVLTILASCKETEFDKARDNFHFIKVHHSFQHPEYVLSDNVMLMDVTYTKAVFVELPKSLIHYTVKNVAFLFITLVTDGIRLIEMPMESFHRLADKVGHPDTRFDRITFLFNIGRCGSTVIARMIEECDPDTIVFSEPPCLFEFITYMRYSPKSFSYHALKSALYLLLKPIDGKKRVIIKPTHFISFTADSIHKVLPNAKMFYCVRDPIRIVWGQERAFSISPTYKMLQFIFYSKMYPHAESIIGLYRFPMLEHYLQKIIKPTTFDTCLVIWVDCYMRYLRHAEIFYYPSIQYDTLLEDPKKFCSEILRLFDLPETLLTRAMSVLNKDAQDGTVLSQDVLHRVPITPHSPELEKRSDEFLDSLQLPRLNWAPYRKKPAYHSAKNGPPTFNDGTSHTNGINGIKKELTDFTKLEKEL